MGASLAVPASGFVRSYLGATESEESLVSPLDADLSGLPPSRLTFRRRTFGCASGSFTYESYNTEPQTEGD